MTGFTSLRSELAQRNTGEAMAESDRELRTEIDDAMERIRRQIDLLREGPTIGGAADDRNVIADLETEYLQLKAARADLPHRQD